jgi:hypothetical protein
LEVGREGTGLFDLHGLFDVAGLLYVHGIISFLLIKGSIGADFFAGGGDLIVSDLAVGEPWAWASLAIC